MSKKGGRKMNAGRNNFQRYGDYGRGGRDGAFNNNNNNSRNMGQHAGGGGGNMQRAGNWNYKRAYNNTGNNNDSAYSTEEGFSKFRDPQQHQQRYNNMRQQRNSNYHGRRGGGAGGDYYRNDNTEIGTKNSFENKAMFGQLSATANMQKEVEAATSTPTVVAPIAKTNTATPANQVGTGVTPASGSPTLPDVSLEDKKPLLHKIKKEKVEQLDAKPTPLAASPASSSSSESSSSSSASETQKIEIKNVKEAPKPMATSLKVSNKEVKAIASPSVHRKKLTVRTESTSTSSSSSSEEDESSTDEKNSTPVVPEKHTKVAKKKSKQKRSSEEDLVCLGKLEKNYVIEDEEETIEGANVVRGKNACILCDKQGHTAFQCQMICKNCSAQYHNHKSCPHPPNLTVMMQNFMEFCMSQMWQYNPEQKFALAPTLSVNGSVDNIATSVPTSPAASSKRKRLPKKIKSNDKKSVKRKRHSTKSDDDDDDDDDDNDDDVQRQEVHTDTSTDSSESDTDSMHSNQASTASKAKVRTQKLITPLDYRNTFAAHGGVPTPFTSFPAFGAAAAAYNPLLFGQMIHGAFAPPTGLNYK